MSILIWVSNGDVQRSNRICSQDQHAQAQHWLRQAQLMHAQHWPRTQSRSRQGGGCPPLPCSHLGPRPMLSMHELSLPEPMLSLSMLILATCPEQPPAGGGGRLLLALFGAPPMLCNEFLAPSQVNTGRSLGSKAAAQGSLLSLA